MPLYRSTGDIKNNKLFAGVKQSILSSFFDQKEIKEAREGEIIYRTGEESNSLYLIIKGEARIKFSSNNYVSNKIHNDFFGEKELSEETKRISSAMAYTNMLYYKIDKELFNSLLKKDPLIDENLKKYGEFKLPETVIDVDKKFNIADRDKPISFKAFAKGRQYEEEIPKEKTPPPVLTQQLLPDLEAIEKSIEEEEIITEDDNIELEEALEKLRGNTIPQISESVDLSSEESLEILSEDQSSIDSTEKETPKAESLPTSSNLYQEPLEPGINREVVRKIFLALNKIYSGISMHDLLTNTKRALKTLTNSESVDLIFIDEKMSLMNKMISKEGKVKIDLFQLTDGLTGICAKQKIPINYDRPTEDSRFDSKIDQPGAARLKRILYFPVISDSGQTVAVIQAARENKKYADDEISYLTMISKQLDTAISRTKALEQILKQEKLSSAEKLRGIIMKEIQVTIEIIDNYTKILSSKNLPTDTDDIIRMMQKQANSAEDITDTVFKVLIDDVVLENYKIHFNEFIDDVLELLSEYCEMKEMKLFKKIGDGALVEVDRSKLYTAILQFVKSSVDDSRKDGRIYFSTELLGSTISITIQNEGKGVISIPEGDVLDYFYYKEKIKEDEVGMLLAIKIINAHSGKVEIESIKGVGSTFHIILPVAKSNH